MPSQEVISQTSKLTNLVPVKGIGFNDTGRIWYRALSAYMTSSTGFYGARTATLNAAESKS